MFDLGLDPGMIAFIPDISAEDLFARVQGILEWTTFLSQNKWLRIHIAPSASQRLRSEGFLPAHEPVEQALQNAGLRHVYSPQDIIRPIYNLLERCITAHHCCLRDEVHDGFGSEPAQPWVRQDVDSITENAVLLGHLERELHRDDRLDSMLSLLAVDRLAFNADIHLVDPPNIEGFAEGDLPRNVQGVVMLVGTVEQLLSNIASEQVWRAATGNRDLKLAIKLRCRERLAATGAYGGLNKLPEFYVGSGFFRSLAERGATGAGKYAAHTLDCCAAAVLNLPIIDLNEFHKNPRKADGAVPLRAHITKAKDAMRLMMWQRPAKGNTAPSLEFANVGTKWEEEIVYSDPADAV